jgi:hypothetical protein
MIKDDPDRPVQEALLHLALKAAPRRHGGYELLRTVMRGDDARIERIAPATEGGGYNPDEPRIAAGQTGGGQWTTGGGAGNGDGSSSAGGATHRAPGDPVPVVLRDGTVVINPVTHEPLFMPYGVSLEDNAKFGESIANDPSFFAGSELPVKEDENGAAIHAGSFDGLSRHGGQIEDILQ